jgi:hypothetical protein
MRELFVDFNGFDQRGNLPLSPMTLAKLDRPLESGEEVCFTDGEVRALGRVFPLSDGTWEGRGDWKFADC